MKRSSEAPGYHCTYTHKQMHVLEIAMCKTYAKYTIGVNTVVWQTDRTGETEKTKYGVEANLVRRDV